MSRSEQKLSSPFSVSDPNSRDDLESVRESVNLTPFTVRRRVIPSRADRDRDPGGANDLTVARDATASRFASYELITLDVRKLVCVIF